nr:SCO family protein [Schlegelella koreensis]
MGLTVAAAAVASGCDRLGAARAPQFNGTDITGAEFARRLELPDASGKVRTLADWKGKVVVVFFGFTNCPDVCPTTMAELAQVRQALGADGGRLQVVFVTLDPERDTPEVLQRYVTNFGPDFVALRGTPEQTAAVAKEFKIFYGKVPGKTPGSYSVDHTAASFVFDPQGRARLFESYGRGAEALTADLKALLASS